MARKRYNAPVPADRATGLIPRDFRSVPVGSIPHAPALPDDELIPEAEWPDRLAELRATESGLLEVRAANYDILQSLDQDGYGLCWAFSTTKAVMYLRCAMNALDMVLSAWYVAGKINNWADRGGFSAASLAFTVEVGVPEISYCPSYDRRYDTPEAKVNAGLHRVSEWWDGSDNPHKAQEQMISMLLQRRPCVCDIKAMGHSMVAIDIESLNPLTIIYDNSWGDGPNQGLYYGRGANALPASLVVPRVSHATAA